MFEPARFLFQVAVIIGVSRLFAWLLQKVGQPQVVGEMIAGIALGPSALGLLAPQVFRAVFPADSLPYLDALAQPGLVIFVFLVGLRVDFAELKAQIAATASASLLSVAVPFAGGFLVAQHIYARYGNGHPTTFALFFATAMSVTAFPVLARILAEHRLLDTPIGVVAISCAAISDMAAWILITAILAEMPGGSGHGGVWITFGLLAGLIAALWAVGRVIEWGAGRVKVEKPGLGMIAVFVMLALLAGAAGQWIGIHPLVGAFLAGLMTPRRFQDQLVAAVEPVTLLLMLPMFFALTGLRTNFIITAASWPDFLLILAVAIAAKWGTGLLSGRMHGMGWREASELGLLLNTRGLVQLVVLTIGLERGILQPALFSMMAAMAVLTTLMASPLVRTRERRATPR